jgi:hypothetical protein
MSAKPGRNDPCPCGSGKKYKHCHLPLEEGARTSEPATETEEAPPAANALSTLEDTVRVLEELQLTGDAKQREEAGRILKRSRPLMAYMKRQAEIQAATEAIAGHQEEFAKFTGDATAFQNGVETLFAEERFVPLRFTPEDLQRAFDHEGSLMAVAREKFADHARKIILYLADKDYRTSAAASLLAMMPDYTSAGRWMEASLILSCARVTSGDRETANPFLWQMFVHGYQAWTAAKTARLGA